MSTSALNGLLRYLYDTLTPDNMRWMATHLNEYADLTDNKNMSPYTREELVARIEAAERQIAMGNYTDADDMLKELDEDLALDEQSGVAPTFEQVNVAAI